MGIRNLHQFLRKNCPQVYHVIPIHKYAFKKIAIDTSIFMCKYKNSNGNNYMDSFLHLITKLRYYDVHFVFVYDSKAPPEKDQERKLRTEAREKNKLRVLHLVNSWYTFKEKLTMDQNTLSKEDLSATDDETLSTFLQKLLEINEKLDIHDIDNELHRLQNTLITVRTEDFNLTKEFFKACNIPFIDAEGEAEATCSFLVRQGLVAAVLTEDTDVLAYGVPYMLHKLDLLNNTIVEIDYDEILHQLDLTPSQFLDFCILCGTDYNSNIYKIGPDKAYKLLKLHKNIEGIIENVPNLSYSVLNYQKVRHLFQPTLNTTFHIPYCGFPNKNLFENLYFIHNCKYDLKKLYHSFHYSTFHDFETKNTTSEEDHSTTKKTFLLTHLS
jgi:5'-3' exonuclease